MLHLLRSRLERDEGIAARPLANFDNLLDNVLLLPLLFLVWTIRDLCHLLRISVQNDQHVKCFRLELVRVNAHVGVIGINNDMPLMDRLV